VHQLEDSHEDEIEKRQGHGPVSLDQGDPRKPYSDQSDDILGTHRVVAYQKPLSRGSDIHFIRVTNLGAGQTRNQIVSRPDFRILVNEPLAALNGVLGRLRTELIGSLPDVSN
jgi:hypothetical protein